MRAGSLDRQITVQRKSTDKDPDYGTQKVQWLPLVPVSTSQPLVGQKFWAQVMDILPSRGEAVSNALNIARGPARFRLRYRDDIDSSMRILLHGDGPDLVYQIISPPATVAKEGRKTMIEIVGERIL